MCPHVGALELEGWENTNIGISDIFFGNAHVLKCGNIVKAENSSKEMHER